MLTDCLLAYFLKRPLLCTDLLYNNEDVIEGISKSEFKNLLSLATQELCFIFNDVLEPTMANIFLSFYEVKWLEQCPEEFKPVFSRRYDDDIFVLLKLAEHLSKFCDHFKTCHPNMSFSFEQEKNGKLLFLDIISWEKGNLEQLFIGSLLLVACTPPS